MSWSGGDDVPPEAEPVGGLLILLFMFIVALLAIAGGFL